MTTTLASKTMQGFSMNVRQGYSVWLGALARLDVLSGSDKYYTFFMPQNVTIHRTPFERAEDVYLNRAGTLLRPTYDTRPELIECLSNLTRPTTTSSSMVLAGSQYRARASLTCS